MKIIHCYLKKNRDKSVANRHPWVFSGAIHKIVDEDGAGAGAEVRVLTYDGKFLARGFYSPDSQIRCRLLRWQDKPIDRAFLEKKIRQAVALRADFMREGDTAWRVINSEGDGLPGLVVDRYADVLVVQIMTAGMEQRKEMICEILENELSPAVIYEKSDGIIRSEEGLAAHAAALKGELPREGVEISENGLRYMVDIAGGQKTGFYLDQRDNRALIAGLARGKRVLNCFSYSGGFTLSALKGGAERVISVDSSRSALKLAQRNCELNGFTCAEDDFVVTDVFQYLRDVESSFDLIILDPPALAKHKRDVESAARAYKDVNLHALKLLQGGGLLLSCSCSRHVSPDLFQKILFSAASDAGKTVRILAERAHAPDHPIDIYHPESRYLHAFLLQVVES